MIDKENFVWLDEIGCLARLVTLGAYVSLVSYSVRGIDYEVMVDNDEFSFLPEHEEIEPRGEVQ